MQSRSTTLQPEQAITEKMILVIDDNEMFRSIFAEWLQLEGFCPITAQNGMEGIYLAQVHQPDLIFCDVKMPCMNGIEVFKHLQQNPNTSHISFYFLTSETIGSYPGASGVILKGADIQGIYQVLTMLRAQ